MAMVSLYCEGVDFYLNAAKQSAAVLKVLI